MSRLPRTALMVSSWNVPMIAVSALGVLQLPCLIPEAMHMHGLATAASDGSHAPISIRKAWGAPGEHVTRTRLNRHLRDLTLRTHSILG